MAEQLLSAADTVSRRSRSTPGPEVPGAANSVVGNQALIDRVFTTLDTEAAGRRLLIDEGLSLRFPHFASRRPYFGYDVVRPRYGAGGWCVTLCGDRRGGTPMHRIAMFGYDEHGREALERLGLSVQTGPTWIDWVAL